MNIFLKTDENGNEYFSMPRSLIDKMVQPYIDDLRNDYDNMLIDIANDIQHMMDENIKFRTEYKLIDTREIQSNLDKINNVLDKMRNVGLPIKIVN